MADKKQQDRKQAAAEGRKREADAEGKKRKAGRGEKKTQAASEKKKDGPSRRSGALSVGLGIFGMIWTVIVYIRKGPGMEPMIGLIFVFLCLLHATYNFQAVKRQEAIDRGEIPDPASAGEGKKKDRYPVYHVKKRPANILKKRRARRE